MNSQEYEHADEILQKAILLIEKNELQGFSKEETETLREMAKAWASAKGAVFIAGTLGRALKWLLGMGVAWAAFKVGLIDWLRQNLGK